MPKKASQSNFAIEAFARYFFDYGGWRALFQSPFFHVALALTIVLLPTWGSGWAATTAISVVPAMLGFSIAAFTFSLGMGTDEFRLMMGLKLGQPKKSMVGTISTAFVHFVFVQTLALIFSLICSAHWVSFLLSVFGSNWDALQTSTRSCLTALKWLSGGMCTLLFSYAILSGLPAIFNIYGAAGTFEDYASNKLKDGTSKETQCCCRKEIDK